METNQTLLQTLAISSPDWPAFAAALPTALRESTEPAPSSLADDVSALLKTQSPELAAYFDRPHPSGAQKLDVIPSVLTIGTILFLLRTDIVIERNENGRICFRVQHKAMDNELVTKVLDALNRWFSMGKTPK